MSVYMDFNSTTPLAPEVIDCITQSLRDDWANPSSDSVMGQKACEVIKMARFAVMEMINAKSPLDIVFTSGGTESNNTAILSAVDWGSEYHSKPHIILSNVEHIATSAPIKHLAAKGVIDYSEVPVNHNGCLEVSDIIANVRPQTVLVTVMMANNETGVIFPIKEIGRELENLNKKRKHKIWFHVDSAQAIGKIKVDVQELGVDYMTIVGHKFYGPRIGALYVRCGVVSPVVRGGGQERGLRPGTENTPMIVGLGAAARLVIQGLDKYNVHMCEMRDTLYKQLKRKLASGFVVNCEESHRLPNTLSIAFPGCVLTGHQLLALCPHFIASTTAACHDQSQLSETLLRSRVPTDLAKTTIRLSVGRDTSTADIETVVEDLEAALKI